MKAASAGRMALLRGCGQAPPALLQAWMSHLSEEAAPRSSLPAALPDLAFLIQTEMTHRVELRAGNFYRIGVTSSSIVCLRAVGFHRWSVGVSTDK